MIKVKRLKKLLNQVPDNAEVYVYEGVDTGIAIITKNKSWWIRTLDIEKEDTYTEGFEEEI